MLKNLKARFKGKKLMLLKESLELKIESELKTKK
jgi:hypothetical protein